MILFVINSSTRGVASLIEAAHYIGERRKCGPCAMLPAIKTRFRIFLCMQQLPEATLIEGHSITKTEAKVQRVRARECQVMGAAGFEPGPRLSDGHGQPQQRARVHRHWHVCRGLDRPSQQLGAGPPSRIGGLSIKTARMEAKCRCQSSGRLPGVSVVVDACDAA